MMEGPIKAAGDLAAEVQQLRERLLGIEAVVTGHVGDFRLAHAVADFHASHVGTPQAKLHRLVGVVAEEWGIRRDVLLGPSREAQNIRPRFVLCWLLHSVGRYSLPQIGRMVGGRDHTTVMHACRRVDGWRDRDAGFALVTDHLLDIAKLVFNGPKPAPIEATGEADSDGEVAA